MAVANIITNADIYNAINVDLAGRLNCKGQANETIVVGNFIAKAQRQVMGLVAQYRYGGQLEVEAQFSVETIPQPLKDAVIAQVEYNLNNLNITRLGGIVTGSGGNSEKFGIEERIQASWSPEAFQILRNGGYLYTGHCNGTRWL